MCTKRLVFAFRLLVEEEEEEEEEDEEEEEEEIGVAVESC